MQDPSAWHVDQKNEINGQYMALTFRIVSKLFPIFIKNYLSDSHSIGFWAIPRSIIR